MRISIPLLVVALIITGCGTPERDAEFTIIHGTDPHLFEEPGKQRPDESEPEPAKVRQFKENLNKDALTAFFGAIRSLPGADASRRVVVVTGDFGIDRSWTDQVPTTRGAKNPQSAPAHQRADQVKRLADILKASPVADVYVVPGNNDLENERATDDVLGYIGQFFLDVQKELGSSRVTLHDLTACYNPKTPAPTGCVADLPGTGVRLIGFPSHSFKNGTKDAYGANRTLQQTQIEKFASLVAGAKAHDRKVIVVSHIPDLDDPYLLARERFTGVAPDLQGNGERPRWSSWNVSPEVFARWKEVVDSSAVLGVLAGHLHDSHREIYRRPYPWSTLSSLRPDPRKLFLAPPLAVKVQETSPIQARGFSVLELTGDQLSQRLYWLEAQSGRFDAEAALGRPRGALARSVLDPHGPVMWLWDLSGQDLDSLQRLTVICIAFLMAFLTVARLWTVPRTPTELTGLREVPTAAPKQASEKPAVVPEDESPLKSNLGKTILSGLGGLAAVAFLEPFFNKTGTTSKPYYLVWFVVIFVVLLSAFAILRGLVEAWRMRIASEHRPVRWQPRTPDPCPPQGNPPRWYRRLPAWIGHESRYWASRFWKWWLSLRSPVLVFLDTSLSVFFGENVLRNAALSDTIAGLQLSMILAVDRVRESVTISVQHALLRALKDGVAAPGGGGAAPIAEGVPAGGPAVPAGGPAVPAGGPAVPAPEHKAADFELPDDNAVRVSISVLSPDGASVFYISSARGSLARPFPRQSVAWVAVESGEARWWRTAYSLGDVPSKIVLHSNAGRKLEARDGPLYLREYFQARGSEDYKAFIVIPVPRRGQDGDYWKAGIHISFSREEYLKKLWPFLEPTMKESSDTYYNTFYNKAGRVLDRDMLRDDELRAVLYGSIEVLTELLRQFNMAVYHTYVKPRLLR